MILKSLIVLFPFLIFSSISFGKVLYLIEQMRKKKNLEYMILYFSLLVVMIIFLCFLPYLIYNIFSYILNSWFVTIIMALISLGIGYNLTKIIFYLIIPTLEETDIIKWYSKNFAKKNIIKKPINLSGKSRANTIFKINNYLNKNGFQNVICMEIDAVGYAETYIDPKDEQHIIYIYDGCINMPWEKLISVIGHELGHIIRKNNTKMDKIRRIVGGIVVFILPSISLFIVYLFEKNMNSFIGIIFILFFAIFSIISLLYMILYFSFNNIRFWLQIDEIYCDRIACQLPEVNPENLIKVFKDFKYDMKNSEKKKWFDKYYIKYYLILEHPCLNYRIKLLKKYKKWNVIEYIKHFNVMFFWLVTGRGWNGE